MMTATEFARQRLGFDAEEYSRQELVSEKEDLKTQITWCYGKIIVAIVTVIGLVVCLIAAHVGNAPVVSALSGIAAGYFLHYLKNFLEHRFQLQVMVAAIEECLYDGRWTSQEPE